MPRNKAGGLLNRHSLSITKLKTPRSLKPQQSRQLIRRFHTLLKVRLGVLAKLSSEEVAKSTQEYKSGYSGFVLDKKTGNSGFHVGTEGLEELLGKLDAEIAQRGGIEGYQVASTQGQDKDRGGDSLKKLIEWMRELAKANKIANSPALPTQPPRNITALEIGSLSTTNHISKSNFFSDITRIDLNSNHPQILEQDFMQRPLPMTSEESFNLISCSLVVNFVPTPKGRGEMLIRLGQFLKPPLELSSLFFVLPLPCTTNSRYLNKSLFLEIMSSLGFVLTKYHESSKLSYWLFDWNGEISGRKFPKKELKSGAKLNNFCIIIE